MSDVIDLFLQYAAIDTQSSETTGTHPSTARQHVLAELLYQQLREYGATEVSYDREHCYVYAKLAAVGVPSDRRLGFIAHMDTSPEVSGCHVQPSIVRHYDGTDIILNAGLGITLSPADFPELRNYIGKSLIVTDGTTLLGADDKAGIAEIMSMVRYFHEHPERPHGELRIAFTPDEEIGEGTDFFDLDRFDADAAYTVDGGPLGLVEYENFNAASAVVHINGRSVHPGSAKGKMIHASLLAMEFHSGLPVSETPAETEGYEGFYHLTDLSGTVEHAELHYIIRDHDRAAFEKRKENLFRIASGMNQAYGRDLVHVTVTDSYYNMKEVMLQHMDLIDNVRAAMDALQIPFQTAPIRGGTDGARLSFAGLPCPNLCTGGMNYHGRYEYACVEEMEQIVQLLILLAESPSGIQR